MTPDSEAIAGILFHGAVCPAGAAPAIAMRDLHELLADDVLALEIHAWLDDGGPDAEQFYCAVDLVSVRLAADDLLAARAHTIVVRDDAASTALLALEQRFARAGYDGAAHRCQAAVAALRPSPLVRSSLSVVGPGSFSRR